jgi:hypothetical protein
MATLENPLDNPCFGCGPRHPRGLHLEYEEVAGPEGVQEVRTTFTPQADEIGWPGLYHSGLHFTVLYEVSYWAALTLEHRLMVSTGPAVYDTVRLPRVGRTYRARAHLGPRVEGGRRVRAVTESTDGRPCGSLESTWRPISRAEVERAGVRLPEYLLDELDR